MINGRMSRRSSRFTTQSPDTTEYVLHVQNVRVVMDRSPLYVEREDGAHLVSFSKGQPFFSHGAE